MYRADAPRRHIEYPAHGDKLDVVVLLVLPRVGDNRLPMILLDQHVHGMLVRGGLQLVAPVLGVPQCYQEIGERSIVRTEGCLSQSWSVRKWCNGGQLITSSAASSICSTRSSASFRASMRGCMTMGEWADVEG